MYVNYENFLVRSDYSQFAVFGSNFYFNNGSVSFASLFRDSRTRGEKEPCSSTMCWLYGDFRLSCHQ